MNEARDSLTQIDEWLARLRELAKQEKVERSTSKTQGPADQTDFSDALDDDLNISAALGVLFESIRRINGAMDKGKLDGASANAWLDWWKRSNTVLDLEGEAETIIPPEVTQLAKERENARRETNWNASDE